MNNAEKNDKAIALDYLHSTGMDVENAANFVRAVVAMGKGGMTIMIESSGFGKPKNSATINKETVENAKAILRGLRLLKRGGQ